MARSRSTPPPSAATKPTNATPNRSSRLASAAEAPDAANTATPARSAMSSAVTVLTVLLGDGLRDLLALRADREALRVTRWNPDLAAQCLDRRALDHRLHELLLGRHIVREALVIALVHAIVDAFLGDGAGVAPG